MRESLAGRSGAKAKRQAGIGGWPLPAKTRSRARASRVARRELGKILVRRAYRPVSRATREAKDFFDKWRRPLSAPWPVLVRGFRCPSAVAYSTLTPVYSIICFQ